jgi:hypothetical protein
MANITEAEILQGLLESGLGASGNLFLNTPNDPLVKLTQNFLQSGVDSMREILESKGRNASSSLAQSLDPTDLTQNGKGFEMNIKANAYAKFVDKGVKGTGEAISNPEAKQTYATNFYPDSEGEYYSFKIGTGVSPSFAESIKQWLVNKPTSLPPTTEVAYNVAKNIKKRGIDGANFVDEAFDQESIKNFSKAVLKIVGGSMKIKFSEHGDNN